MPSLFPERTNFWTAISNSEELKIFVDNNIEIYLQLYIKFGKGKDKYANLFLAWLDHIRSYTCKEFMTTGRDDWSDILYKYSPESISEGTQRTMLASILHAVQDGIQSQIAPKLIEGSESTTRSEISDDTALYRISGWAVKSAIDHRQRDIMHARGKKELVESDLKLLKSMRLPQEAKVTLPIGAQLLDRGGLTFVKSEFLPWIRAVEASMKRFLNRNGYQRYGKNIFKVSGTDHAYILLHAI